MANYSVSKSFNINRTVNGGKNNRNGVCSTSFSFSEYNDYISNSVSIRVNYTSNENGARYMDFSCGGSSTSVQTSGGPTGSISATVYPATKVSNASVSMWNWLNPDARSDYVTTYTDAVITLGVVADFNVNPLVPLTDSEVSWSSSNEFQWEYSIVDLASIRSQSLYWKLSTDTTYTRIDIDKDSRSYVFPAGTFSNGIINWYIRGVDSFDNVATSSVQTVNVGVNPSVKISYPISTNLKNDIKQVFTWEMYESIFTGQYAYELGYRKSGETDWVVISNIIDTQYHEFDANTFDTAQYEWRLKVENNDRNVTDYVYSSFNAIGATGSPVVTNVTNSSIPTFTWEIESQDTFELEIYRGTDRLYSSGVCVGENVREYTPNIMLADGNYIIKMRAMNEYGYFTDWLEYAFNLDTEKPLAYTCYAYASNNLGVNIIRSLELDDVVIGAPSNATVPDAIYVLRRISGSNDDFAIIGKLSVENEKATYTDTAVLNGVTYEYALRNYMENGGYTDSNSVLIRIDYSGFCIYNDSEYVNLFLTENDLLTYNHKPSKSYSYSSTIGREYPIKESTEWLNHSVGFSCFATLNEYKKIFDMYKSNNKLWFKNNDFSFLASIDEINIVNTLQNQGYTLSIQISRIDEEELKLF